jgi:transporter family protein
LAFPGERPSRREWTGIAMVAAGVLLLAFKREIPDLPP